MSRKFTEIGKVKRTSEKGVFYNPQTGQVFEKVGKGQYNMVIEDIDRKLHRESMSQIRNNIKKYPGIGYEMMLASEKALWDDFRKSVREFNKGNIVNPQTIQKRYQQWRLLNKANKDFFSKYKKAVRVADRNERYKVMTTRMWGISGVYNGRLYDSFVNAIASKIGESFEVTEGLLFPVMMNENSYYEDVQKWKNNNDNERNIENFLEEKVKNGEIDEDTKEEIINSIDLYFG